MPAEFASTRDIDGLRRTRAGGDAFIAELAGRQHGVVFLGVYAVGHRVLLPQGRWTAAVLSSGSGAVLSHRAAAALWGIRDSAPGPIDVTISHRSRSSTLIRRHLVELPRDEVTASEGIPVTIVPRTIFDLAARWSVDRVESAIRQAEYLRLYDRLSLLDMIDRYPGRRGVRRVRRALARIETLPTGRTRSRLEERFLPFLRRHGLPRPRLNDWIAVGEERFEVDCHWSGTGQVVELDSWKAHGTRSAFREDRARDRTLRTAGYAVTRISWAQLDDEPEAVAADLRKLLNHARVASRWRS